MAAHSASSVPTLYSGDKAAHTTSHNTGQDCESLLPTGEKFIRKSVPLMSAAVLVYVTAQQGRVMGSQSH